MNEHKKFPFTRADGTLGEASMMPFLPVQLLQENNRIAETGLLDTGAPVNVLPFSVGVRLGLIWEKQTIPLRLTGNLAFNDARAVLIHTQIEDLPIVRMAFAWTQNDHVPLILGQTNFFMEYDVCFFRHQLFFEIHPKKHS
jgi:hypothetical protein